MKACVCLAMVWGACAGQTPPRAVPVAPQATVSGPAAAPPVATPPQASTPPKATSSGDGFAELRLSGVGEGDGRGEGICLCVETDAEHHARARIGDIKVSGGLPREVIHAVVRRKQAPLLTCYERARLRNPRAEGGVTVAFVIDASGNVVEPRDGGSSFADAEVVACVIKGFAGLRFPAPEGGETRVTVPLLFVPPAPAAR